LATNRAPIVPPAPPRFSTTTDCPIVSLIFSATMRATSETLPPGGNGETSMIGRVG